MKKKFWYMDIVLKTRLWEKDEELIEVKLSKHNGKYNILYVYYFRVPETIDIKTFSLEGLFLVEKIWAKCFS